jgi:hypothetical protein
LHPVSQGGADQAGVELRKTRLFDRRYRNLFLCSRGVDSRQSLHFFVARDDMTTSYKFQEEK